jgi:hypothetical protein
VKIDRAIFLNQIAQGITALNTGRSWFDSLPVVEQREVLRQLNAMILQAHALQSEAEQAGRQSGVPLGSTPATLLVAGDLRKQLAKIASLPETKLCTAFVLLITLMGLADKRRRTTEQLDLINHWWHRDLSDERVVSKIRRDYELGRLSLARS